MNIELCFFASVREALGTSIATVDVPASVVTVGDLRWWLCERGGVWQEALAASRPLKMALDQELTAPDALLRPGCEVAFFPPVTGG